MMKMKLIRPALAGFFLALAVPALAVAADAAPSAAGVIDLRPLIETVAQLLIAGVSAVGLWVAKLAAAKLRIQADSDAAAALDRAIANGINLAGHKIADLVSAKIPEVHIQNALVADAAAYVVATMPDTIKRFGLTPDRVQELIRARLPVPVPAAAGSS